MTPLFADSSFYIAITGPADNWHHKANEISRVNRRRIVTTQFVLTEVANLLSGVGDRAVFIELLKQLQDDPNTSIVQSSNSLWQRGIALFAGRADKEWSLTDCISMVVMNEQHLSDALTTDHHFEQAGFEILLK